MTRGQWLILVVAWLGWVFDVMDTALFNFAKTPMLMQMLGPSGYAGRGPQIEGLIQTVFLVGWAVGGLIFGVLADRWGRVRVMALTILIYCLFTGLTALAQTWEQVLVIRFLTALGIGGEWAAGAALVAEVVPNRARAGAAGFLQSAAAIGPALAAVANLALAAQGWRALFLIGVVPAVLTVVIRLAVHEPERWARAPKPERSPLAEVFSVASLRRNAVVAILLGVVGIAGAGNVSFWLPNLVRAASEGMAEAAIQQRTSYAILVLHVGTILGVFAFPWIADRFGRRPAFAAFFVMAPVSVWAATLGGADYGRLLLVAPVMSFFTIGLTAGFALYFPELFTTAVRATGAGLAYNTGRILAAPVPWATGLLIGGAKGSAAEGVARAALIYVMGLLALVRAPETRGRDLPEGD